MKGGKGREAGAMLGGEGEGREGRDHVGEERVCWGGGDLCCLHREY